MVIHGTLCCANIALYITINYTIAVASGKVNPFLNAQLMINEFSANVYSPHYQPIRQHESILRLFYFATFRQLREYSVSAHCALAQHLK